MLCAEGNIRINRFKHGWSLDHTLFFSVYNTKRRALSAKLVWLLVTRFGGMPLEQMEVFLFSDLRLGASTGHQWNVTQSSLDHRAGFWRMAGWTVWMQGEGRHLHIKEKERLGCAVHHLYDLCHKAPRGLGLFVSVWGPVTQRGRSEMGTWFKVWGVIFF